MKPSVVRIVLEKRAVSVSELIRRGAVSVYSAYNTIKELESFGIVSFKKGKIELLANPASSAFSRLFFEGFDVNILSAKNVGFLVLLVEEKTTDELAKGAGLSIAQTNRQLNSIMQFLFKQKNKYMVSQGHVLLIDFLRAIKETKKQGVWWQKGEELLLKLPKEFACEGSLTGFSRFTEYGLMIFPSHKFVFQPKKELSIEEILVHAIKFSTNANELMLCILFYLKNKHKANILEIEKNAKKFGVTQLWLDIVTFLEDRETKNAKMFLPKKEFLDKAGLYNLRIVEKFGKESIESIFKEMEKHLKQKTIIFMIGGNALIEYNIKNSTKDIDLIVTSEKELKIVAGALKQMGFAEVKRKELQYEQLGASVMLEKIGAPRVDLFARLICNVLEFSSGMRKRSKKIKDGLVELRLASLEDVFLLKSISSRDSDIYDCESILAKAKINWKTIDKEIELQEKNLKKLAELTILDHLEILEQRLKIKIPLTKKILSLAVEKAVLFLAKQPITVKYILKKIDFPETTVRNKIQKLVRQKKLKKIRGTPFKVLAVKRNE